ncbi:MAG: acyl-CoA thioesterase [Phycisphaerae bacterium]
MPREYTTTRRVQFAETDMAGVMHFANYFRWMEEIEHEFFRSLGTSIMSTHEDKPIGWPRVRASCEYFGPVRFEDVVDVQMTITDLTEKSMTYEALFSCNGKRTARGRIKAVCCQMTDDSFQSIPIPDAIRDRIDTPNT